MPKVKPQEDREAEIDKLEAELRGINSDIARGEPCLLSIKSNLESRLKKLRHNKTVSKYRNSKLESLSVLTAKEKALKEKIEMAQISEKEKLQKRLDNKKLADEKIARKLAKDEYEQKRIEKTKEVGSKFMRKTDEGFDNSIFDWNKSK